MAFKKPEIEVDLCDQVNTQIKNVRISDETLIEGINSWGAIFIYQKEIGS